MLAGCGAPPAQLPLPAGLPGAPSMQVLCAGAAAAVPCFPPVPNGMRTRWPAGLLPRPKTAAAWLWAQCAVGFSGVLFGLKVVLSHDSPGWSTVYGVRLPTKVGLTAQQGSNSLSLA